MVEITYTKGEAILKFPKKLVSAACVQQFLERLRLETIAEKSKLTQKQAWELSEQLKEEWWQKNKDNILQRINR
jgi:hypothetical protein